MQKYTTGLIGLMLWSACGLAAGTTPLPPGLAPALEAARCAIDAQGEDYLAHNARNRHRIVFRNGGVEVSALVPGMTTGSKRVPEAGQTPETRSSPAPAADWRWGLRLQGYGTPDAIQPVAAAQGKAEGIRLEFRRGLVTEWYENRPVGLEQGFTLHSPPSPKATELVLVLAVTGGLHASWETPGQSLRFHTAAGEEVLTYRDLSVIDANGARLPAHLALGPERLEIHADTRGAEWPIVVDPLIVSEQEKLTDSDGAEGDTFGYSVALSGHTALVGAPGDDYHGHETGSAIVFTRIDSAWVQEARLTATDGVESAFFGGVVALEGETAIVGAYNGLVVQAGSAYVFTRTDGYWNQRAKLTALDGAVDDYFGEAVAISGDTVLVGSPGSGASGAAYVFTRAGESWTQQAKL